MKYDPILIGRVIRSIRENKGISQEVLSGLANISRSHLSMIENGKKKANIETLWKLSSALNMKLSDLIKIIENNIC